MAQATEDFQSRTGDVSSTRPGYTASRTFNVTVDKPASGAPWPNADDVLRDPTTLPESVPTSQEHPTRPGLFAEVFTVGQRKSYLTWPVRVTYLPPITFTQTGEEWEYQWSSGLSQELVTRDLNGAPIGPATYQPTTINEPPPPGSKAFSVTIPAIGDELADTQLLFRFDDPSDTSLVTKPSFLTEIPKSVPTGSFSFLREFNTLDPVTIGNFEMLGGVINSLEFFGFPPQSVQYVGLNSHAGPGTNSVTNLPGFVWRISINFQWNINGYRWRAQDVFRESKTGLELPVIDESGNPVIRERRQYGEVDLSFIPDTLLQIGTQ